MYVLHLGGQNHSHFSSFVAMSPSTKAGGLVYCT